MVNCIPVFIAREEYWNNRFKKAGLPIVGDDIKSQVGATIVHRQLARLFGDRGVELQRTSQLNVGGNMDFYNMLERERLESKKISKTNAVTSIVDHEMPAHDVHVGPSDYVPWLDGPQVGPHPPRGRGLRRRPADRRAQARGLGLPELGRHRHRRRPLLQAGHEPRRRRPARRPELLPHEVADEPAPGRRRRARRPRSSSPQHARAEKVARAAREKAAKAEARRRRSSRRGPAGRSARLSCAMVSDRFAIAQVTPHPWEDAHEVDAFVAIARGGARAPRAPHGRARALALARAGARVAPADPRARRALRPGRRRPVLGVGELLPLAPRGGARPGAAARRRAHDRGGARVRAARLRARARAVRAERRVGRAAPLARAQRRHVPRARRARDLHPGRPPLRGALLRPPRRANGLVRGHAGAHGARVPGALRGDRPRCRRDRARSRAGRRAGPHRLRGPRGPPGAAPVRPRAAPPADGAAVAGDRLHPPARGRARSAAPPACATG